MIERRKDRRYPIQGNVKIGYDLDDLELCHKIECDGGKVVTNRITKDGKFILEDCPNCKGRGFLPKKGKPNV